MKILHCIATLSNGGAERQVSVLAPAQLQGGQEAHVAYIRGGQHLETLQRGTVPTHELRAAGNYDVTLIGQLSTLISRIDPDVIHTWLPMMDVLGGALALSRRRRWVMSERSNAEAYLARFTDRVVRAQLGRFADAVVANSEAGADVWRGRLRAGARVHIVRNALPVGEISRAPRADLTGLGLPGAAPTIIFAGRLSWEKNIDLLLQIIARVAAASDASFVICGDGPLREQVSAATDSGPLAGRVRVLGSRTDLWSLIKAATLFISTSNFEGQPNAVLEAMVCGCPLVVTDIASHREFLDSTNAVLAPPTVEAFSNAVFQVLATPGAARERALAAQRYALGYTAARAAEAYAEIYQQLIPV